MTTLEGPAERYRRRRRWPILTLITLMLIAAGVVWFQILRPTPALATGCNEPGAAPTSASSTSRSRSSSSVEETASDPTAESTADAGASTTPSSPAAAASTSLGQYVDHQTLATVRPANPQTIALQVYNGSTTRGQAGTLTTELRNGGFQSIKDAKDDVLYPASDLNCYGQIRYGAAGSAQARTVLMVAPCAQLVMDNRFDASVDLAIGQLYRFDGISPEVAAQLQQIIDDSAPPPVIEGQTAAARPLAPIPPLPQVDCSAGPPALSPTTGAPSSSPTSSPSSAPSSDLGIPTEGSAESSTSLPPETVTPQFPDDTESGEAPEVAPDDGADDLFGG